MNEKNRKKVDRRRIFQSRGKWFCHRSWYIYTAAKGIEEPFSLGHLQEAIYQKVGLRPKTDTILREAHEFYEKYDTPIITREEPSSDVFRVNQDIDLSKESYRAIMQPPQGRGRPRKHYAQIPGYSRRYNRNMQRLTVHPERFLAKIFDSMKQGSVQDIVECLPELTEGTCFGPKLVGKLLAKYATEVRGPPYIREVEPGVYRKVTKPTAIKYSS